MYSLAFTLIPLSTIHPDENPRDDKPSKDRSSDEEDNLGKEAMGHVFGPVVENLLIDLIGKHDEVVLARNLTMLLRMSVNNGPVGLFG